MGPCREPQGRHRGHGRLRPAGRVLDRQQAALARPGELFKFDLEVEKHVGVRPGKRESIYFQVEGSKNLLETKIIIKITKWSRLPVCIIVFTTR